ncbi:MAG: AAA family ATPase [Thaumarchaeota archaeon]|nr:AAA family ATPase [Nitrososphaerota archaeon]
MQIGKPASPDELVDRDSEVNAIVSKMRSRINYNLAVIGYRRIGKSSILTKAAHILSKGDKTVVVYFDVKKYLGDPKSFLVNLQAAIFNAYLKKLGRLERIKAKTWSLDPVGKIAEALSSKRIKGIGMEITNSPSGDIGIMPKLEFAEKDIDYMHMFLAVFKTANALAEKNGIRFVMILDEFQDIVNLHRYRGLKNILDLFRSVIQERGDSVSYIVCGSHVHLLRSILSGGKSSLFQHFTQIGVGEMDKKNSMILFNAYLDAKGQRQDNKTASSAYDLVGGQPYYLMALAEGWEPKKKISSVFQDLITSSVGSLRLYAEYVLAEDIATAQGGPMLKAILIKLALSQTGLSYSEIGKALGISTTSVVPYMNELVKTDLAVKEGTAYSIRDKIVREYLRLNMV